MFSEPIQGDPLTYFKEGHISLDWHDVTATEQARVYTKQLDHVEHVNEELGWSEYLEQLTEPELGYDISARWWEYRGRACRDGVPAPLVILFYTAANTSWRFLADREGLILLAFEDHRNQKLAGGFLGGLGFGPGDDEIWSYDVIIDRVLGKYGCDRGRVYACGLSFGDYSLLVYAGKYGKKLAGIASVNGPVAPFNMERYRLRETVPELPVLQIRSDYDTTCDGYKEGDHFEKYTYRPWYRYIRSKVVTTNRNLWTERNGCDIRTPEIRTEGNRAFLRYPGANCDVIYAEYHRNSHVIPIDNAEVMWDNLFSRYRRDADGAVVETAPPPAADRNAVALVAGLDRAYINNKKTELCAPCCVLDPRETLPPVSEMAFREEASYSTFYAPAELLMLALGISWTYRKNDVQMTVWNEGRGNDAIRLEDGVISFSWNGSSYCLYTDCTVVSVDGKIRSLKRPPLWIRGVLMLPVCEVAELLGFHASAYNDAVYLCGHPFELGLSLSRYLREEILPDEVYVMTCSVRTYPSEHGTFTVNAETLREGDTLILNVFPEEGYRAVPRTAINGVDFRATAIGENEYWICNLMGDADVAVDFVPESSSGM